MPIQINELELLPQQQPAPATPPSSAPASRSPAAAGPQQFSDWLADQALQAWRLKAD